MNKEIKLRAWHTIDRNMLPAITLNNLTFQVANLKISPETIKKRNKSLIWLQYTGIKDKNGVEIYEGYVLQSKLNDKQIYQIKWNERDTGYVTSEYESLGYSVEVYDLIVIGNIYENPDLLTN